jgi:hypothetical protein
MPPVNQEIAFTAAAKLTLRLDPSLAHSRLNRRTAHGPVRAEYAAIARLWPQADSAALAVVEELAGIRGHRLGGLMAASRTSQD